MNYIVALCFASMKVDIMKVDEADSFLSVNHEDIKFLKSFNTEFEAENFRQRVIQTHSSLKLQSNGKTR